MISDLEDLVDNDLDDETLDDLKYRYLEILKDEGCLNEVCFDRPDWDEDSDKYTKEYHGVEKLMEMIPAEVLIRQFGALKVLPLLDARDTQKGDAA